MSQRWKLNNFLVGLCVCLSAACSGGWQTGRMATPSAATPAGDAAIAPATTTAPSAARPQRTPLRVFCAGSLVIPFAQLETAFEAANPEIDMQSECHGSIQVIRHVTELHEAIDIVATADAALIPMLMYPARQPESGQPYASWYAAWATNRLALAYGPYSRGRDAITPANWYEILQRPGIRLGLADPRFDAAGYRGLMALKLAEHTYAQPGLFRRLFQDAFRFPISAFEDEDGIEIGVPEIVEPTPGGRIVLRGASIQLIALLESGDLDYAFEYESVIRQHHLDYVPLPDTLNLGAPEQAAYYARVTVKLDFQRFASVKPVFQGEPIAYGLTIPVDAPHPAAAERFIAFLLGPAGQAVMQANFQPLIQPPVCDGGQHAPPAIQALCRP